jgi:hypothetical protein
VPLEFGQQLFDGQAECLELFFFYPHGGRATIVALHQEAEGAVAGLADRLGLEPSGGPEDVLGFKHCYA